MHSCLLLCICCCCCCCCCCSSFTVIAAAIDNDDDDDLDNFDNLGINSLFFMMKVLLSLLLLNMMTILKMVCELFPCDLFFSLQSACRGREA